MKGQQLVVKTNLPIDLLIWVIKDDPIKLGVLRTYIYLKLFYPDRIVWSEEVIKDISIGLKIDPKTAKSHIKTLKAENFIGTDKVTNVYYVRSKFKVIPKQSRVSKYLLSISVQNLDNITEYALAAVVAYMVKKRMDKHKLALINEGAQQRMCRIHSKYHIGLPLSLSYIAKFLGKSISWVDKYKRKAKQLRLIIVKPNLNDAKVRWIDRFEFLKANNLTPGMIRKYQGRVYLKGSDLLSSNIRVKSGKKVYE